ncbi:uncharacterized protein K452DRAFT_320016 [Aplosporella prunicola CBS 121167]|uniref:Zn(2)-C6 fungal-type domain-containing protein n=1 Tax=Aplosporella prunicola CBS 121167 TaxID=1176127 RepID=A0A6A6B8M7_9PEZI|nr:uncharacterized protein K452DRAFT_320016 [Aplosporella prunicola CBS 121167]KAF2139918.1 hypothetical protein K452DRAFT_320016 [Aplosporella prunicola CBS 121167]
MADNAYGIETPPKVTRVRPQLSCIPCRQGKLKCNRAHPACDQCVKRSRESACNYVPPPPKDRGRKAKDMRGRIRHLEGLVVDLMNGKDPRALNLPGFSDPSSAARRLPTPEHASPDYHTSHDGPKTHSNSGDDEPLTASAFGALRISDAQTTYTGGSHWTAILHDIKEVKNLLENEDDDEEEPEKPEPEFDEEKPFRFSLVVGSPPPVSKKDLLRSLPPKAEVDRLVTLWYNSQDPTLTIHHIPTFQTEYRRFWSDPSSTPIMWISLIYGILSVASIYELRTVPESPTPEYSQKAMRASEKYRTHAASAAVIGEYAKPKPYTLEALMEIAAAEYLGGNGTATEVWLAFGVLIRLALRMGYHRDPSHYGNISPFHGEMRRRVWHLIYPLDVLFSFALGLPGTVRRFQSDTLPPRNLHDHDLSPDMEELPPERPVTEITPVSYSISKSRLIAVFAAAADASHAVTPSSYPEIMELDHRLKEAHALIPPALRMHSLNQSIADPPELIMNRFNLEMLYQKARCVLHRTYLVKAHDDPTYEHSRQACLEAALRLLELQSTIYYACQPGGQLKQVKWYFSSLTSHDFLLAAMLACLELNLENQKGTPPGAEEIATRDFAIKLFKVMENSSLIWDSYEANLIDSAEARRAAKAFRTILTKLRVKCPVLRAVSMVNQSSTEPFTGASIPMPSTATASSEPGATFMSSEPPLPVVDAPAGAYNAPNSDPLGDMLDMPPMNINWETWDKNVVTFDDMINEIQQWSIPPNLDASAFSEGYNNDTHFGYRV